MIRSKTVAKWSLCICLLFGGFASAQVIDPQQIVNQFFPQSLLAGTTLDLDQVSCFAVFDFAATGVPNTIITAYSNDFDGLLRVIKRQGDGAYQVIDEVSKFSLGGPKCNVDLRDLDGDGVKEIRVSFDSFRVASADWLFQWNGSHLQNIGPITQPNRGKPRSLLSLTDFVDIYHDGTLQVLSVSGTPSPEDGHFDAPNFLYRLVNGTYVLDAPNLYLRDFSRGTRTPVVESDSFDTFDGSTGPYILKVINGAENGNDRVSSAHISVNGVEVIGPNAFNQRVGLITATVTNLVPRSNSIQVQLESAPGGQITVVIEDHSPEFAQGPPQ